MTTPAPPDDYYTHVREMRAALDVIEAKVRDLRIQIDLLSAKVPIPTDIQRAVCDAFGYHPKTLFDKTRLFRIVVARWCCWRLLHGIGWNYSQIGTVFNGMNHATVMHGISALEAVVAEKHSDYGELARKALGMKA